MLNYRWIRLTLLSAGFAALVAATATAQIPGMPPGAMGGAGQPAAQVPQVELTESSAKNAVDAYLAIKEKYGDEVPAPTARKSAANGFTTLQGVESIIGNHGFSDTGSWHSALISVVLAYGFNKEGNADDVDKSIAKIKDNADIPENLKQQMIAMIAGVRPSENNLSVVKALMTNEDYATKLVKMSE